MCKEIKRCVLPYVEFNPQTSTREIVKECSISENFVRRILKPYKFRSYHFSIGHTLHTEDEFQRIQFC